MAGGISIGTTMFVEQREAVRHRLASWRLSSSSRFPMIRLPDGYEIEKVADGLTYPTSVVWDDEGTMYVAEAGGAFLDEEDGSARILRLEDGEATEVVNLDDEIYPSISGMTWHDGAFYVTHREEDLSGAVSRVTPDGERTQILGGVVDAKSDHQLNDIRVGGDGRMYVCSGIAGNSGFMDQVMIPFVQKAPDGHPTAAEDVVLRGVNVELPDFREGESGTVRTGAFVPFGTETEPGQVIEGRDKCGGAILAFDPQNAEETVEPHAWGLRNAVGIAWDQRGELFVAENGYDNAPGRPISENYDATYIVQEGAWYGWPDFTAKMEPVTSPKYKPTKSTLAPQYVDGERQPEELSFLIDHEASGLEQPDESLVAGLHEVNASPSKPDVAPGSWGEYANQLFVPEYGDLSWTTNALRDKPAGCRVGVIDTEGESQQKVRAFVQNAKPGPASEQGRVGEGLERPYDVKFGPDGAMYIVDFGVQRINRGRIAQGHLPVEWDPETGMVWRVAPAAY